MNAPVPPTTGVPPPHVTRLPPISTESIDVLAENPAPITVTVDPTGPIVGVLVIVNCGVTVNWSVESIEPSLAVVAETGYGLLAAELDGTTNEQVNVPSPATVCGSPLVHVTGDGPNCIETVSPEENPVADTAVDVPGGPVPGPVILICGSTRNEELAEIAPSVLVEPATRYGPWDSPGIVRVQANDPSPATTTAPSMHGSSAPAKVAWTASPAVNPVPRSTVVLPAYPLVGLIVNSGGPTTVKVADPEVKTTSVATTFRPPSSPAGADGTVKVQG